MESKERAQKIELQGSPNAQAATHQIRLRSINSIVKSQATSRDTIPLLRAFKENHTTNLPTQQHQSKRIEKYTTKYLMKNTASLDSVNTGYSPGPSKARAAYPS